MRGVVALAVACAATPALAADALVRIENAWVRPANEKQESTPLYADVTSDVALKLVGANSEAAASAALLVTGQDGERTVATPVRSFEVAAGAKFRLAPRGPFVELREITRQLRTGDSVPFTLEFTTADGRTVRASGQAVVRGLMPRPPDYEVVAPGK
jgi:copper(I)-binding protein